MSFYPFQLAACTHYIGYIAAKSGPFCGIPDISDRRRFKYYKKRSGETQTLRAVCSKAEPKIFAPLQTPFLGARNGQNLISWRWSLPLPINPVWWGSMHAISSYRC